jgi:hypothetical protein
MENINSVEISGECNMENVNKTDIDETNTAKYKRPSYMNYMEYNEGLEWKRENINIDEKSEIVRVLKPKNDPENKSLADKLLIDVKFPLGYMFSIAGRGQIENAKEFDQLFTLSIKVQNNNKKELNPESRIFIHKEKEIDDYLTNVVRLESPFYKDVSINSFYKEGKNSIKTTDKLYKFGQGVEFKGDEHLRIYVVDSDIDISPEDIELNINLDKWIHS